MSGVVELIGKIVAGVVSLALAPALLLAVAIDLWAGDSLSLIFQAGFVAFGLIVGVAAFLLGRHKGFWVAPALYLLCILAMPFVDLGPVKPAVRAVGEMQPGMSEGQVFSILDRYFPEGGRFKRPKMGPVYRGRLSFALDPSDGSYNSAVVQVVFTDGKCVSAHFLPD